MNKNFKFGVVSLLFLSYIQCFSQGYDITRMFHVMAILDEVKQ